MQVRHEGGGRRMVRVGPVRLQHPIVQAARILQQRAQERERGFVLHGRRRRSHVRMVGRVEDRGRHHLRRTVLRRLRGPERRRERGTILTESETATPHGEDE